MYMHELDYTGLTFPLSINDISKFEKLNLTIAVSVHYINADKRTFYPIRVMSQRPEASYK